MNGNGFNRATRYHAAIRGKEPSTIELEPMGEGRLVVALGDKRHEVDALRIGDRTLSILIDGRSHRLDFEELGDEWVLLLNSQEVRVDVVDERRFRLRGATAGFSTHGKQLVTAPMPGKIVHVLVRLGDQVREGQGLVVIEAMKMENELKSTKAGKVVELLAAEGSTVEKNAKLVVVE